ncbi:hypothetical protein H6P81_014824 [Aristolochia fimbriata]|uniref:Uncharacterized protein n=1 Tax=Aristolochia fimbriata TaxID=158543 RepID=A0AAV7E5K9_ARIFI|nr:hypothetical protein H6P81_014824 [Aristolochia fimbriata]
MGNCIDLLCSAAQDTIKVVIFNGEQEEFVASTTVEQVTSGTYRGYSLVHNAQPHSPLPPDMELVSGEVYYLVPSLVPPSSPSSQLMAGKAGCGEQIRVVLTRKQLQDLLMKGGNGSNAEEFACRVIERCGVQQRWKPTLMTIPELQDC